MSSDAGGGIFPTEVEAAVDAHDAYADFLDEMESLGFLHDLDDDLPPDFSAVFEIGRILASPESAVGRAVSTALQLRSAGSAPDDGEAEDPESRIEVPAAEEYEAEFIHSWADVQHVYSWQWLLPDEVFLRRLAQRTLWFPSAKAPRIRAIESGGDDFQPAPTKQKAYVLLDTSASMALHHRFPFAKAIVLRFLRENRRELGEVFLRTFDVEVGPLESARDTPSYDALLKRVARRRTLGNGTCLERAILRACADIRERRGLAGAEILVVTDGAAHLDEFTVREALGDDVELHCVKLGNVAVAASEHWLNDQLDFALADRTHREQKILHIRERRDRLKRALTEARDQSIRRGIIQGLAENEIERQAVAGELRAEYGREIENLSHVYVQVPDLNPASLRLTAEQLAALERLVREMLERLAAAPAPPHVMKQAALLLSHIAMLSAEQTDAATRESMERLRQALENELTGAVDHHSQKVIEAGLLSSGDQRDLQVLLRRGVTRYSSLWVALRAYWMGFVRLFR
ncbi:MAG: VWA domain-containing protein [Planctomycetes bacterium]|nr:VWA domain-containing protein [Planctomycetota bacterium]